jgi:nicotinate-nucleotide pyrophosphorylase (carboxylating)
MSLAPEKSAALGTPPSIMIEPIVRAALLEDLGRAGDLTTDAIVPEGAQTSGVIRARKPGRLCGLPCAIIAFRLLDPALEIAVDLNDGADLEPGATVATLRGSARAILTGERTALNFLGRLSGIATATNRLVKLCEGTKASVVDTRKTTPNLRVLEKYAVRMGGGMNHRFGLDDAVLIKDNHVAYAGGIAAAIGAVRDQVGHLVKIELEVDSIAQLHEGLDAGAHVILLDNFSPEQMREAVKITAGKAILEASGNITEASIRAIAESGVDIISSGWITHSAPNLDLGLDFI